MIINYYHCQGCGQIIASEDTKTNCFICGSSVVAVDDQREWLDEVGYVFKCFCGKVIIADFTTPKCPVCYSTMNGLYNTKFAVGEFGLSCNKKEEEENEEEEF